MSRGECGGARPLSIPEAAMLDRRAAIHHDVQPGLMGDPRRLPVHDTELEPQAARPDLDRLLRVHLAFLRSAEDVDDVERARRIGGFPPGAERRNAEDVALARVDRDAFVALVDEV